MNRDESYMQWLEGVGRQMEAARRMARALSDMRDIESYDRIKCETALMEWDEACGRPWPKPVRKEP